MYALWDLRPAVVTVIGSDPSSMLLLVLEVALLLRLPWCWTGVSARLPDDEEALLRENDGLPATAMDRRFGVDKDEEDDEEEGKPA